MRRHLVALTLLNILTLGGVAHAAMASDPCPDLSGDYVGDQGKTLNVELETLSSGARFHLVDQDQKILNIDVGHTEIGDGDTVDVSCEQDQLGIVEKTHWEVDLNSHDYSYTDDVEQNTKIWHFLESVRFQRQSAMVRSVETLALSRSSSGLQSNSTTHLTFVNLHTGERLTVTDSDNLSYRLRALTKTSKD